MLIHKTGRRIACEVSSVLFQDSEGRSFHSTIVRDITRQKETEEEVKKRELILSAIAEASYRLLLEEEIDTAIEYSLQLIGKIVHADRVYVFENSTGSGEAVNAQLSHEWCAPDIASQQGENENRTEADYMFYIEPLRKNKFFSAVFSELKDPQLRQRWQEQHISSLLILPILMHGEVWGFVGFDECHYERQWTTWEIDILRAFASSLGGAIQRRKNEANLSATNIKLANAVNDLSKIMDYSMDVICSFNENGEFIQVSAASEKVWGYKADEVIGKKITDFIPKDDFENASDLVGLMKGGESVSTNFENRFRRKDGTHVFLEWSAYWYEKERIAFCVARDITLQKEIEKQLVASETRFRAFMNNSPACSWIADEDGILMYLNKTSIETLPVEYDDIGKNIFALFPKEVAASFHQNNLSVLMMNKPAETIENVPFKNGTTGTILVYLFPIQFEEKKGRRIVGCVAIDITSKTRAEEALRSSERNLKAIFSSTKDAFYLLDKDLVIKSYNKVASKLFQSYSNSNNDLVTGTSVLEIIRPDRRPNFENQMMTVLNGQSISYEIAVEINGGAVWCQVQAEPVIANNVVEGICLSIADVTSKKSAEEKIKQTAEQLTSIMETISDGMFILKNDFTVQYMNRSAEELLEVKRKHFIGKGKDEIYHLLTLGNNNKSEFSFPYLEKALEKRKMVSFSEYYPRLSAWFEGEIYPLGNGLTIYFRDITERKRQEMTLRLEKEVLEMNALPESSLDLTVDHFLKGIETIYPGMLCSVILLREDKQHIKPLSSPSIPKEYSKAIDWTPIGPKAGSCGTAMFLKKAVYVTNIQTDPLWKEFRELAAEFDLGACWSIPIITGKEDIAGSLAIYYRQPKEPLEHEIKAIERASDILRVILENKKAAEQIRLSNERYHFVTKATNEAIWDLDLLSNNIYWAEGYNTLFGYDPEVVHGSLTDSQDRVHPGDTDRIKKSLKSFLQKKTRTKWEDEYRYKKADGSYAYVLDKAYLIQDKDGNPIRLIGSMQDITGRRELEQKLLEQEVGKQKLLTQATIDGQEKERKEIGKELHDNINQILSTTKLYLDLAHTTSEGVTSEMIGVSSRNIMEAINEIRKLSRALVPPTLGDLGLIESIKDLCENFVNTNAFTVDFQHKNIKENQIADNQKLMLFRIIQEQTNNIIKHAKARHVKIHLRVLKGNVTLKITDDGEGFNLAKTKKGVGLTNIINRAELFNGHVEIVTAPNKGCSLQVKIPLIN